MKDIEDLLQDNSLLNFVKDLSSVHFKSKSEYDKTYQIMRKKYKMNPSKPTIRKTYIHLLQKNLISNNESIIEYTLKRKTRSHSGVSVITILTSPFPKYTNSKGEIVEQSFSCSHNCAYCPNEPDVYLDLIIYEIDDNFIHVKTDDDITNIHVLTYLIKDNIQYDVEECSNFNDNSFTIQLRNKENNKQFVILEKIIGFKIAQPRSYLTDEPAVRRANRDNFDPLLQIYDRADALTSCGHEVDKIELLVLGGTWDHYPLGYQTEFIRDIYHSINTLTTRSGDKLSLEEEINLAETSNKRIIGLTLETRPDCVTMKQIKKLRKFNVTRLQIGVQHIDDDVLKLIERGCTTEDTIKATYLWKQNGGKIDMHFMPDLPGSSIEKDIEMFRKLFSVKSIVEKNKNHFVYDLEYPELQADQLKIYPCSVVNWTKIKEWYESGFYKPYSENESDLIKVIVLIKQNVFPWIRINRIIRDIPNSYIIGGNKNVNLHQKINDTENVKSMDIRTREVKNNKQNVHLAQLFIREYNGVDSTEYFISYESPDQDILYAFLRLRINHLNNNLIYDDLINSTLVRELHVYGNIVKHSSKDGNQIQHQGFGKKLLYQAEKLSLEMGFDKIAIISGVGVREYYKKNGYHLSNNYMIKSINNNPSFIKEYLIYFTIISLVISIIYDLYY
jgi:ELP3 family radical SAM enzyme/protein acetyltransferase